MKRITLPRQFDSEEKCIAFLETLRWPEGVRCPKCANDRISRFQASGKTGKVRQLYQCLGCRYQFSVRTGTIFHDSHLPLQKWFTAMALVGDSGGTISANQLRQVLGVQYKTAWQLGNRLRDAMQQSVEDTLQARVEAGEAPGSIGSHSGQAAWERQVFLRFLEGAGRGGAGAVSMREPAFSSALTAAGSRLATGNALPRPERAATPKNGGLLNGRLAAFENPVDNLLSFWKREVFDSFPVVGARHIPGYMNEVTYLFGKIFISALPTGLLCPIGQEIKRTVGTQPLGATKAAK